jgi:hypothetical protein
MISRADRAPTQGGRNVLFSAQFLMTRDPLTAPIERPDSRMPRWSLPCARRLCPWAPVRAVSLSWLLRMGLRCVSFDSWPRGGHRAGGWSPACRILTPVLRHVPPARRCAWPTPWGPAGPRAWMLWREVPQRPEISHQTSSPTGGLAR